MTSNKTDISTLHSIDLVRGQLLVKISTVDFTCAHKILWFCYIYVCVWVKWTLLFYSINYWQHFSIIPNKNDWALVTEKKKMQCFQIRMMQRKLHINFQTLFFFLNWGRVRDQHWNNQNFWSPQWFLYSSYMMWFRWSPHHCLIKWKQVCLCWNSIDTRVEELPYM